MMDLFNLVFYCVLSCYLKEGSVSSVSGEVFNWGELSVSDWSDLGYEVEDWLGFGLLRSIRKFVL